MKKTVYIIRRTISGEKTCYIGRSNRGYEQWWREDSCQPRKYGWKSAKGAEKHIQELFPQLVFDGVVKDCKYDVIPVDYCDFEDVDGDASILCTYGKEIKNDNQRIT